MAPNTRPKNTRTPSGTLARCRRRSGKIRKLTSNKCKRYYTTPLLQESFHEVEEEFAGQEPKRLRARGHLSIVSPVRAVVRWGVHPRDSHGGHQRERDSENTLKGAALSGNDLEKHLAHMLGLVANQSGPVYRADREKSNPEPVHLNFVQRKLREGLS